MDAIISRDKESTSYVYQTQQKVSIKLARIEERLAKIESDIDKNWQEIRAVNSRLDQNLNLLIEMTDNRFLWTILTVLASNVLPLVFHAAKLI